MIFCFDGEDLAWDAVSRASEVDEPIHNLRGHSFTTRVSNSRATVGSSSKSTGPAASIPLEVVDEDASDPETDGEEYEDYISASDGEDEDDASIEGSDNDSWMG